MISLYCITHELLEYASMSLKSILSVVDSSKLDVTVIDAKSCRSDEISVWGRKLVDNGRINRFVSASENCKGEGLVWAFENFPPSGKFCVFTDLDLLVDFDWLADTEASFFEYYPYEVTGYSLKTDNYVKPNYGFVENGFGTWLMGCEVDFYRNYLKNYSTHIDGQVLNTANCWWKSTKTLYHSGWDAWKDYPEYWERRKKGVDWEKRTNSLYTIYEK